MIDIWFLFLLIVIVLTIIFHTAIAFLLGSYSQSFTRTEGGDQVALQLLLLAIVVDVTEVVGDACYRCHTSCRWTK